MDLPPGLLDMFPTVHPWRQCWRFGCRYLRHGGGSGRGRGAALKVHPILQPEHGIDILENMETRELPADDVNECFCVLGQARLRGAVQMIINPIAIR
ncbi:hypothetical protein [Jiella mangrovi]|uniref:Uncharacterized protein n=1 Tax=Jiella mangrovi TaxID=2821407 RepID=A0ABS4BJH4_9HYPH|nr:hypothetical protein [Jiella mangrovi]MBP0616901.1 hypothetical protein [Jiella mangrovi]